VRGLLQLDDPLRVVVPLLVGRGVAE